MFKGVKITDEQKEHYITFLEDIQEDLVIPAITETIQNKNPAGWIRNLGGL